MYRIGHGARTTGRIVKPGFRVAKNIVFLSSRRESKELEKCFFFEFFTALEVTRISKIPPGQCQGLVIKNIEIYLCFDIYSNQYIIDKDSFKCC